MTEVVRAAAPATVVEASSQPAGSGASASPLRSRDGGCLKVKLYLANPLDRHDLSLRAVFNDRSNCRRKHRRTTMRHAVRSERLGGYVQRSANDDSALCKPLTVISSNHCAQIVRRFISIT